MHISTAVKIGWVVMTLSAVSPLYAANGDSQGQGMFRMNPQHTGVVETKGVPHLPKLKWEFSTHGALYSSPVVAHHTIFVGSSDKHVYAVNTKDGTLKWRFSTKAPVSATPLVEGNHVYVVDNAGNFYALNARNGAQLWAFHTHEGNQIFDPWDYFYSSPTPVGALIVFGSANHHLYALDKHTGKLTWTFTAGAGIRSTPAYRDGYVYVGDWRGDFYKIDAKNGKMAWKYRNPNDSKEPVFQVGPYHVYWDSIQSSPAVDNSGVYYGSRDANTYSLDLKTGKPKWITPDGGTSWVPSSPALYHGTVYVGTSDAHVFEALNEKTGTVKWTFKTPSNVFASPVVDRGIVYVATGWGYSQWMPGPGDHVYALNATTGKELWSLPVTAPIDASPAVKDGVLYVASTNGTLYAYH